MANESDHKREMPNQPPALPGRGAKPEGGAASGALPPKRVFGAWMVVGLLLLFMLGMFYYKPEGEMKPMDQLEFRGLVEEGRIEKVELVRDANGMTYLRGVRKGAAKERFRVNLIPSENLEQFLLEKKIPCPLVYNTNVFGALLREILPVILILVILYFVFIRQIKSANMGAMSFGKSRAKMLNQDKKKLTFANVAGIREAKEEVQEIVEYLKDPQKFQKLGGRIPKGVLLMGPPGTGKTLLAKAIAGEAGVPFFSISGSDFVEMFVGVGASRVRDMFEQGKKHAPCLIFIDEIDAVGRSRFSGIGGGHDEREQTLNALLVEMDGFETAEGVIIIAATNRADVLDPALLRPGRFDRQIIIDLPTLQGREEILRMHAAKIKLARDADLARIARGTPGFSGADLANLLNEAALLAARSDKRSVGQADLEEARDKVLWGRERRSRAMDDRERRITAWHESGHALLQVLCEHAEPLHKVTIIPRGQALGATMSLPERDVLTRTRSELLDQLVVLMGGRIAEKLFTDDLSTGARMDIKMASEIARKMICSYGMSDRFGFQSFGDNQETLFLGREVARNQAYSEETAKEIDAEVSRLVAEAYARAERMLCDNREKLERLVECLLEAETLDGRDVEGLIRHGRLPDGAPALQEDVREDGPAPADPAVPAGNGAPQERPEEPPELLL
ncbi:MAG: ATP-dependent zinc metalloprotease FtsH [Kiritimatiellia bacterium]|jgi:cell division protease FtsH|nr:ATP-dependent zinc metalloprotease FtsH [Kiritimatiellia bacterium]